MLSLLENYVDDDPTCRQGDDQAEEVISFSFPDFPRDIIFPCIPVYRHLYLGHKVGASRKFADAVFPLASAIIAECH